MDRFTITSLIFGLILISLVFFSGCSDTPDTAAGTDTTVVPTTAGPAYTAGDIVKSASGTDSPAWLIVSYDAATDSYSRALIYKNTDGSYGYRTSPATETSKRQNLEKVYTIKITHVGIDSVPTSAPTTVTTVLTAGPTRTAVPIITATATATTVSNARPSIKKMSPDEGEAGTTVKTEITGSDFADNLTAKLRHSGEDSITAKTVSWYSSSSVTCTFLIPNTTKAGSWDIVLTNPNGLSGEITDYFLVHGNKTPTT